MQAACTRCCAFRHPHAHHWYIADVIQHSHYATCRRCSHATRCSHLCALTRRCTMQVLHDKAVPKERLKARAAALHEMGEVFLESGKRHKESSDSGADKEQKNRAAAERMEKVRKGFLRGITLQRVLLQGAAAWWPLGLCFRCRGRQGTATSAAGDTCRIWRGVSFLFLLFSGCACNLDTSPSQALLQCRGHVQVMLDTLEKMDKAEKDAAGGPSSSSAGSSVA